MKIRLSERGQALAEYMPLIPPILLLSVLILVPLSESSGYVFCRMVNAMEPEKCQVVPMEDGEDEQSPGEDPGEQPPWEEPEEPCIELEESRGGSQCDQSSLCTLLPGSQHGMWSPSVPISSVVIKSGQGYFNYDVPGSSDDCYQVAIQTGRIEWWKVGRGRGCKDISHVEAWELPICQH
jgi:hypothetical protein